MSFSQLPAIKKKNFGEAQTKNVPSYFVRALSRYLVRPSHKFETISERNIFACKFANCAMVTLSKDPKRIIYGRL